MAFSCTDKHYAILDYCKGDFRLPLSGPGYKSTSHKVVDEEGKTVNHTCYQWECREYVGTATFCHEKQFHNEQGKLVTEIFCAERQSGNDFGCAARKVGNDKEGYYLVKDDRRHRQGDDDDEDEPCSMKYGCYERFRDWLGSYPVCPLPWDDSSGDGGDQSSPPKPVSPQRPPTPVSPPRPPPQSPLPRPSSPRPPGTEQSCSGCVRSNSRWLCERCE